MTDVETDIRALRYDKDLDAVKRIWREVGWVDKDGEKYLDDFMAVGDAVVATINGEAECCVHITDGTLRLLEEDLPLCAVTAVTTSRIARGHAFARRLTAQQLRRGAEGGAVVAALGMFDQGFYDQLGFGTGGYDNELTFDPGTLKVNARVPTPQRLSLDDYALMHAAMTTRKKVHGSVSLHPQRQMRAELGWSVDGFGLGYRAGDALTHFMWLEPKGERGPYRVSHIAYRDADQLLELLGLLKSLEDQVYSVRMVEPPEIQLQSLLDRPFRNRDVGRKGRFEMGHEAFAWWQLRVLDVAACVGAIRTDAEPVKFQLRLSDPLTDMLDSSEGWCGVAGDYVVALGGQSDATAGTDGSLAVLECSVNALTRMLWGVARPSSLAITDDLSAPDELLVALDHALNIPVPHAGWDF